MVLNPFAQKKDSYSLSPVDGVFVYSSDIFQRIEVAHFANLFLPHLENSWGTARIVLGSLLVTH